MTFLTLLLLTINLFVTASMANVTLLGGRARANMLPMPAMPLVELPATLSPTRNGTGLPPYSTIYYFDQVTILKAILRKSNLPVIPVDRP